MTYATAATVFMVLFAALGLWYAVGWEREMRRHAATQRTLAEYRQQLAGSTATLREANATIRLLSAALRVRHMTIIPSPPRNRMYVN